MTMGNWGRRRLVNSALCLVPMFARILPVDTIRSSKLCRPSACRS